MWPARVREIGDEGGLMEREGDFCSCFCLRDKSAKLGFAVRVIIGKRGGK